MATPALGSIPKDGRRYSSRLVATAELFHAKTKESLNYPIRESSFNRTGDVLKSEIKKWKRKIGRIDDEKAYESNGFFVLLQFWKDKSCDICKKFVAEYETVFNSNEVKFYILFLFFRDSFEDLM